MINFELRPEKAKDANPGSEHASDDSDPLPTLTSEQDIQTEMQTLKQLRLGELVAHKLAYKEHPESSVISLLEEDDVDREYISTRLSSGHGGVVGFIYTPTPVNSRARVYVNFRGTHNTASLHADLEYSAGEKSFHHCLKKMIDQLSQILSCLPTEKKKDLEIIFAGHSLGACYAQYALNACMQFQAQNLLEDLAIFGIDHETQLLITTTQEEWQSYLHKTYQLAPAAISSEQRRVFEMVRTFKVFSLNAPGVSKASENLSNILADILKQNGKQVIGRFALVDRDGIQRLGESNVLLDCNADTALLEMFENKVTTDPIQVLSGFLCPTLQAHTAFHFKANGQIDSSRCFLITQGHTQKGRRYIKQQLGNNKLAIMQNNVILGAKALLCKAGDVGAKIKSTAFQRAMTSKPAP